MADQGFSLVGLKPEPLPFTFYDGTVYGAKSVAMLSPNDLSAFNLAHRRVLVGQAKLMKRPDEKITNQVVQQLDIVIRILVPDLPETHLSELEFVHKLALMSWWQGQAVNASARTNAGKIEEALGGAGAGKAGR